jgi:hypothetical protein
MTGRVVIHIGAMKSGTSYLQSCLYANRELLAEQGVHLPSGGWGTQVAAAINVRGHQLTQAGRSADGAWERMAQEARDNDGVTLFSVELLARLRPNRIRRIINDLDGLDIEIVVSLRDLNRTLPAMWQETVQNGRTWTWAEYLAGVRASAPSRGERSWRDGDETTIARTFWSNHDGAAIVERWSRAASNGRVKVVTVPPPGERPELLLERFAEAVGFDASRFVEGPRSNASLGLPSTEAIRLVNAELTDRDLAFPFALRIRKPLFAKRLMVRRAKDEPRMAFPVERWLARVAREQVRELKQAGVDLYGAWSDLRPVPIKQGIDPTTLVPADVAAALADGYAMLRSELVATRAELEWPEPPSAWQPSGSPEQVLREGAVALSDLIEWGERGEIASAVH